MKNKFFDWLATKIQIIALDMGSGKEMGIRILGRNFMIYKSEVYPVSKIEPWEKAGKYQFGSSIFEEK